jgi:hypothetical protein
MRNAGRWNPKKRRSAAQRAHIESLSTSQSSGKPFTPCEPQTSARKENYTPVVTSFHFNTLHSINLPISSEDRLLASELRTEDYKRRLRNENKKTPEQKSGMESYMRS